MKNKDVEDIVFEALNQYLNLEEKLQGEVTGIVTGKQIGRAHV